MFLHLDNLHKQALHGTTNGYKILKTVDSVNTAWRELNYYGKYRVMARIELQMYKDVRVQEEIVRKKFNQALSASDKMVAVVQSFVKSSISLIKGYELCIQAAKKQGLDKIDVDAWHCESSTGVKYYVVPDEDVKTILRADIMAQGIEPMPCIYSMPELCVLMSGDQIAYEFKTKFDAEMITPEQNEAASN